MTAPTITSSEIARRVAELAKLRRESAEHAERIRLAREAFERTYAVELLGARQAAAAVEIAETALRAVVAEHYATTQEKKPAPGIEVKLRRTLTYDREAAFAWGKSAKLAIIPERLDDKAFEKIARATPLPFVTYADEPMVTLATDLEKALSVAALTAGAATPTEQQSLEE